MILLNFYRIFVFYHVVFLWIFVFLTFCEFFFDFSFVSLQRRCFALPPGLSHPVIHAQMILNAVGVVVIAVMAIVIIGNLYECNVSKSDEMIFLGLPHLAFPSSN
jgi:hypothetical protein